MFQKFSLVLIALFLLQQVKAQNQKDRKTIKTTRVSKAPKIDGVLDDDAWKNAELASDFVIFRPANGVLVPAEYQTTVRIVYDDDAIYISAEMLDPDPEGIPKEFAVRDNFSIADFFLITIKPK